MSEVEDVRDFMQKRHRITLPDVDIRCSTNMIRDGFAVPPMPDWYSEEEMNRIAEYWNSQLRARGLRDLEVEQLNRSKFTIFISSSCLERPLSLQSAKWHEMGHVLAYTLNINDKVQNESVASIYGLIGLLRGAKEGLYKKEEVFDYIDLIVRSVTYERVKAHVFAKMGKMGLKKIPDDLKKPHYYSSLFAVRKYNPKLIFRDRDLDEIMRELDRSLDYALKKALGRTWERKIESILAWIISH